MIAPPEQDAPETLPEPEPPKKEARRTVWFSTKTRTHRDPVIEMLFMLVVGLELILFRSRIDDSEALLKLVVTVTIIVFMYRMFTYDP